jgi:malonyl-CoA O-methyltransferase
MSTIESKDISLVLIHGWGCNQSSWQPLIPELERLYKISLIDLPGFGSAPAVDDYSLPQLLSILISQIPDKSWLVGWSLGGMLAIQLAHIYPQKISGVISLAANAKFVADSTYTSAMSLDVNQHFNQSFAADPVATLKLFSGLLAQGAQDERSLLKMFRKMLTADEVNSNWSQALELLSTLDNQRAISLLKLPCLHIFADGDSLVPVAAATSVVQLNQHHKISIIDQSSHALHWCFPEQTLKLIQNFINSHSEEVDIQFKQQVAKKFSKAAFSYDQASDIQKKAGYRLLSEFAVNTRSPQSGFVLDLGCGTGYFSRALQNRFVNSTVIGVDLSPGMLSVAKQKLMGFGVGGDAEKLPFASESIDVIYSNFSMQWCFDLAGLFNELYRVLKPGGELIFTTLGDKTLYELRSAWGAVDDKQHVNEFSNRESVSASLANYFSVAQMDFEPIQAEFNDISSLLRSLKSIGATHHATTAKGLMGRKKLHLLAEAYEKFRENGKLPLTYDVIFARAIKRDYK